MSEKQYAYPVACQARQHGADRFAGHQLLPFDHPSLSLFCFGSQAPGIFIKIGWFSTFRGHFSMSQSHYAISKSRFAISQSHFSISQSHLSISQSRFAMWQSHSSMSQNGFIICL
jgi:hypothetical protein